MKKEVMQELADKWRRDGQHPECADGSPDAVIPNAEAHGARVQLCKCADALEMLMEILG